MSDPAENDAARSKELTAIEAEAFFYAVFEFLGYDFRHYTDASRNRRLMAFVERHSLGTISRARTGCFVIRVCWPRCYRR